MHFFIVATPSLIHSLELPPQTLRAAHCSATCNKNAFYPAHLDADLRVISLTLVPDVAICSRYYVFHSVSSHNSLCFLHRTSSNTMAAAMAQHAAVAEEEMVRTCWHTTDHGYATMCGWRAPVIMCCCTMGTCGRMTNTARTATAGGICHAAHTRVHHHNMQDAGPTPITKLEQFGIGAAVRVC